MQSPSLHYVFLISWLARNLLRFESFSEKNNRWEGKHSKHEECIFQAAQRAVFIPASRLNSWKEVVRIGWWGRNPPPHHNAMWATTAILTWWIKFSQVIAAADRKWCGRQPAMGIFEPSTLDINVLADPTGLAGTAHFIIQLHPGVGESFSLIGGSPVFPCQVCENFLGTDPVLNEVSPLMKSSSLR